MVKFETSVTSYFGWYGVFFFFFEYYKHGQGINVKKFRAVSCTLLSIVFIFRLIPFLKVRRFSSRSPFSCLTLVSIPLPPVFYLFLFLILMSHHHFFVRLSHIYPSFCFLSLYLLSSCLRSSTPCFPSLHYLLLLLTSIFNFIFPRFLFRILLLLHLHPSFHFFRLSDSLSFTLFYCPVIQNRASGAQRDETPEFVAN